MRRDPRDVLARARALCLLAVVEDGMYLDVLPGLIEQFGLAPALTDRERAWIREEAPFTAHDGYQIEGMLVLAWALGILCTLGDRDPEAYGPMLNLLHGFLPERAEDLLAPRSEDDLRAMLAELDALAASGEDAPPSERLGPDTLHWRRVALRWLLEPSLAWPYDAM